MKRILYPTDFSPSADCALAYALRLADEDDAELHVVHIVSWKKPETIDAHIQDEAKAKLEALLAKHPNHPSMIRHRTIVGQPIHKILVDYAREHNIDLIVQGTHGHQGLKHWVLGSIAEKVTRYAHCPVMTVRLDAPEPQNAPKHLLAAVDFMPPSEDVIRHAQQMAVRYDAKLTVLNVVEQRHPPGTANRTMVYNAKDIPEIETQRKAMLETLCSDLVQNDIQHDLLVLTGHPVTEILGYANAIKADAMIIGVDNDDLAGRYLLGSIVERVVRLAEIPVITVKGGD